MGITTVPTLWIIWLLENTIGETQSTVLEYTVSFQKMLTVIVISNSYCKSASGFLEELQKQKSVHLDLSPISICVSWKQHS